jgi:hypothetical protein
VGGKEGDGEWEKGSVRDVVEKVVKCLNLSRSANRRRDRGSGFQAHQGPSWWASMETKREAELDQARRVKRRYAM